MWSWFVARVVATTTGTAEAVLDTEEFDAITTKERDVEGFAASRAMTAIFVATVLSMGLATRYPCILGTIQYQPAALLQLSSLSDPVLSYPQDSPASLLSLTASEQRVLQPTALLLLSSLSDPVLSDLRDSPASLLSLPESERQRQEALQQLEDDRLEKCRTSRDFDQCFFFGSADAIDARRSMEGDGTLSFKLSAGIPRSLAGAPPLGLSGRPAVRIPTW